LLKASGDCPMTTITDPLAIYNTIRDDQRAEAN